MNWEWMPVDSREGHDGLRAQDRSGNEPGKWRSLWITSIRRFVKS